SLKPEIPEAYEAIILKCLQKRQEDRFQSMKELKQAIEACMDQLGISKELPKAEETDPEMQPVEARPPSSPGYRTPGRPTGPGGPSSKNRISNPNARGSRPGARTPNPNARSNPNAAGRASRPPQHLSQPPQAGGSKAGLFIGIGAGAVAVIAALAFMLVRNANQRVDIAA